jgi:hypothetical protein
LRSTVPTEKKNEQVKVVGFEERPKQSIRFLFFFFWRVEDLPRGSRNIETRPATTPFTLLAHGDHRTDSRILQR